MLEEAWAWGWGGRRGVRVQGAQHLDEVVFLLAINRVRYKTLVLTFIPPWAQPRAPHRPPQRPCAPRPVRRDHVPILRILLRKWPVSQ